MIFDVPFSGHGNVRSLHHNTVEVTAEERLTVRGDCIVGVGAACGCAGLPGRLKCRLRDPGARVRLTVSAGGISHSITGRGHPGLELTHPTDIVARRSSFASPRTVAVECDGAAGSLPRRLVGMLRDPARAGLLRIEA